MVGAVVQWVNAWTDAVAPNYPQNASDFSACGGWAGPKHADMVAGWAKLLPVYCRAPFAYTADSAKTYYAGTVVFGENGEPAQCRTPADVQGYVSGCGYQLYPKDSPLLVPKPFTILCLCNALPNDATSNCNTGLPLP